jgi:ABC-2 type transport system permease protein
VNIVKIVLKGLKQDIRDKRAMAMMIVFPIVLIMILGTAFANVFGNESSINLKGKVLYKIETDKPMAVAFNGIKEGLKDYDIKFTETEDAEKAKAFVLHAIGKKGVLFLVT